MQVELNGRSKPVLAAIRDVTVVLVPEQVAVLGSHRERPDRLHDAHRRAEACDLALLGPRVATEQADIEVEPWLGERCATRHRNQAHGDECAVHQRRKTRARAGYSACVSRITAGLRSPLTFEA